METGTPSKVKARSLYRYHVFSLLFSCRLLTIIIIIFICMSGSVCRLLYLVKCLQRLKEGVGLGVMALAFNPST